jgi:hypothetical protein
VLDRWVPARACHWCGKHDWWQNRHVPEHVVCVNCHADALYNPGGRVVHEGGRKGVRPPVYDDEKKAAADKFRRAK